MSKIVSYAMTRSHHHFGKGNLVLREDLGDPLKPKPLKWFNIYCHLGVIVLFSLEGGLEMLPFN
jgi:hypothetical protein